MEIPDTHYARSADGLKLAYQQWGEGPRLLLIPALVSNVELDWEHEFNRRAREHLGRHLCVVEFDKRGMGLSDRFDRAPTLDERLQDIVSVMDTVGWERANIFGASEGGLMGQLFAAEFPERVEHLILCNTFLGPQHLPRLLDHVRDDDPPLKSLDEFISIFTHIGEGWSDDPERMVDFMMPSQLGNESFTRWIGRFQRFACSPQDFFTQFESTLHLDPGDAPERITAPTLVIHVTGDRVLPVSAGRALADLIAGAKYTELDGEDHYAWIMPNWRELTDAMITFCGGTVTNTAATRQFGTVLFTDIVDSTRQSAAAGDRSWREILDSHDRITRSLVDEHGGRVVKSTGDGLLALFPMPSQGVECARAMLTQLAGIGLAIRAGLHAGELEVREDGDISGLAVNLAARVEQAASDGELWVSSTVRDMTLGGATTFTDQGEHQLKGIEGDWRLFSASFGAT